MKTKNLYRLEAGSYRFKSGRLAIEKWNGVWELLDLEKKYRPDLPVGQYKTLKEAVKAAGRYSKTVSQ